MIDDPEIRTRLRQIADTLNLPVDYFYTEPARPNRIAEANECLRLWSRIRTPEGRRRALEALRAVVEGGEA